MIKVRSFANYLHLLIRPDVQRVAWNLRTAAKDPVQSWWAGFYNPFAGITEGHQVAPGTYTAVLSRWQGGKDDCILGEPVSFNVVSLAKQGSSC